MTTSWIRNLLTAGAVLTLAMLLSAGDCGQTLQDDDDATTGVDNPQPAPDAAPTATPPPAEGPG